MTGEDGIDIVSLAKAETIKRIREMEDAAFFAALDFSRDMCTVSADKQFRATVAHRRRGAGIKRFASFCRRDR